MLYQIYKLESLYIWYNTDANVVNDLWNSLVLWIFWRSNFENTSYITRENQSYSLCKSTKICIAYTDAFTLMISFVFSSWIINEFHNNFCNWQVTRQSFVKWSPSPPPSPSTKKILRHAFSVANLYMRTIDETFGNIGDLRTSNLTFVFFSSSEPELKHNDNDKVKRILRKTQLPFFEP